MSSTRKPSTRQRRRTNRATRRRMRPGLIRGFPQAVTMERGAVVSGSGGCDGRSKGRTRTGNRPHRQLGWSIAVADASAVPRRPTQETSTRMRCRVARRVREGYRRKPMGMNASVESPTYRKFKQDDGAATPHFGISCDEGWRESIVCTGMYEWVADWMLEQLQGKPFAEAPRSTRTVLDARRMVWPGDEVLA